MMANVSQALAANSDQLNADDLVTGPITVTITRVDVLERKAADTQSIVIHIDGGRQPFKPCKSMGRVIAHCWGGESDNWEGRSLTLYRDPEVVFGGKRVGGIRISHMSHIDRRAEIALTETRGKKALFTVEPLVMQPKLSPGKVWERLKTICGSESVAIETLSEKFGLTTFKGISADKLLEINVYCDQQQGGT